MLFQVVEKFDTVQRGVSMPNILLTPRTPIRGEISWFLKKCIFKHSSLLVCRYWVYGWSSQTGLTRSQPPPPPSWLCLGLAPCWPEVILKEWELHGGHSSTHWGRVPRTITTFWRNWGTKHQTQTFLHCQVVVQHANWMQIWWLSTRKKLKGLNSRTDFWPPLL